MEQVDHLADPAGGELEAIWDAEWEKHLFAAAVESVKRQVNPEHYQLFDHFVVQQWPVRKITATLRVNAGQVYLAKHRVGALLRKVIKKLEGAGGR